MRVLYTIFQAEKISADLQQRWFDECPSNKQARIARLHYREDQLRTLIGLQLLKQALAIEYSEDFDLKTVRFHEKRKPYCPFPVDFSISHSGVLVTCVVSQKEKVGIDTEEIREIDSQKFKRYFSVSELAIFRQDNTAFFTFWSIKEAVIKAADLVSFANLRAIRINGNIARLSEQDWYLHPLELHPRFKTTVATNEPNSGIITEKVTIA